MPPIALQLYSVRHEFSADMPGTLAAVARMGYSAVEFAGPPQHSAAALKTELNELGLACCGWHVPFNLVQDDELDTTIAFHHALGNDKLIIPGIPEELRQSRNDWLKLAEFTNRLAARLAAEGMRTGYHNHFHEFLPLDGETPWDTYFGNTDPSVIMQFDTGNAIFGGADAVNVIRSYPGRAVTVHLKPFTKRLHDGADHNYPTPPSIRLSARMTPTGRHCSKPANWSAAPKWYIVEYESDAYPPLEAVERCLGALRGMGK